MESGVYAIVNTANGRRYIGSARDIPARWKQHLYSLRGNRHGNQHLQHAWNKYGEQSFDFVVLETVSNADDVLRCEQSWLDKCWNEALYNMNPVAAAPPDVRLFLTDELRKKLGDANRGKPRPATVTAKALATLAARKAAGEIKYVPPMQGKKHSPETKAKMSAAMRGRRPSEETLEKLSAVRTGRVVSPETRAKMSASQRKRYGATNE